MIIEKNFIQVHRYRIIHNLNSRFGAVFSDTTACWPACREPFSSGGLLRCAFSGLRGRISKVIAEPVKFDYD
jgi:hypothetical protein